MAVKDLSKERWKVIPARPDMREMNRITMERDETFLIGYVIRESVNKFAAAEDDRRARLAALSPELLDVLQQLVYFHDTNDTPNTDPWRLARDLIKKANAE